MSFLVDTNVLLRSIEPKHPMQRIAADSVILLRQQRKRLVLAPQNVYEFWVAATRPIAQNGLGLTAPEAEAEVTRFKSSFFILDDIPAILRIWEHLVIQHQVIGKSAHDARRVAAMLVHGVDRLLTFNKADFARYASIVVISPQDVVSPPPTP